MRKMEPRIVTEEHLPNCSNSLANASVTMSTPLQCGQLSCPDAIRESSHQTSLILLPCCVKREADCCINSALFLPLVQTIGENGFGEFVRLQMSHKNLPKVMALCFQLSIIRSGDRIDLSARVACWCSSVNPALPGSRVA